MAMWHGCRGLDHLLRRRCDLAQQLSHMQQIQLAGACQVWPIQRGTASDANTSIPACSTGQASITIYMADGQGVHKL